MFVLEDWFDGAPLSEGDEVVESGGPKVLTPGDRPPGLPPKLNLARPFSSM